MNQIVHVVTRDEEAWRVSLILAALENLIKFDNDAPARAVYRARYLDLTDGRLPK